MEYLGGLAAATAIPSRVRGNCYLFQGLLHRYSSPFESLCALAALKGIIILTESNPLWFWRLDIEGVKSTCEAITMSTHRFPLLRGTKDEQPAQPSEQKKESTRLPDSRPPTDMKENQPPQPKNAPKREQGDCVTESQVVCEAEEDSNERHVFESADEKVTKDRGKGVARTEDRKTGPGDNEANRVHHKEAQGADTLEAK